MSAREWFSPQELADMRLPGMPTTDRGWRKQVQKNLAMTRTKERGKGIEIHLAALPIKARAKVEAHPAVQAAMRHEEVLPATPEVAVATPDVAPITARSGEPILAGLPSPVNSSPAATVAGGLTPAGGDMFVAGIKAGMVLAKAEDRKAMEKRVKVAERRLNIIKPIIDWPEGKAGKSAFVIAQAASHGETRATLYRWVKLFQHGGFDALMDKPRADKNAARVMKGQVAWLEPRDLMGEFAKLAGVAEVIDRAEHGQRVIELTPEARAIADARKAQMLQTIESAANQKVAILDRRFDQSVDADAEAARALGF